MPQVGFGESGESGLPREGREVVSYRQLAKARDHVYTCQI